MAIEKIRVGIIGADVNASWAKVSHVPAVQGLEELELTAVATRDEESARTAAKEFGVKHWYSDPFKMINDPKIDLITVAVRVPAHNDLVLAVLEAGKAVYCESPLGANEAEAETMLKSVGSRVVAVGLQARLNPAVRRASELIKAGKIGKPLVARIVSTSLSFGSAFPDTYDYFNKESSGANLITITGGHTLDVLEAVLGPIAEVNAEAPILFPNVTLVDSGRTSKREVPDQLNVIGKLKDGGVFNVYVAGDTPFEAAQFSFEIKGTDGWLKLSGGHPYGFQAGDLKLTSSASFDAPDTPRVTGGILNAAINVAEVYASLVQDIRTGSRNTPNFKNALHNTRLIGQVLKSAKSGERVKIPSSLNF